MFLQVVMEIVEGFQVGVHTLFLGVGYKYHAVHTAQDQFPAGIVENLSWNGIQVKPSLKSADCSQIQGQEVEEQRTVGFRRQGDHFPLLLIAGLVVDDLQIRGFAAEAGAVIDNFAVDLSGGEVNETQRPSLCSGGLPTPSGF